MKSYLNFLKIQQNEQSSLLTKEIKLQNIIHMIFMNQGSFHIFMDEVPIQVVDHLKKMIKLII